MKYLPMETIEAQAMQVLHRADAVGIPVAADVVAERLGLMVELVPLGEEISGVLVIEKGKGMIGVNEAHPHTRQRFTIAHEVGHFVLHGAEIQLFIDKRYTAVYRDRRSSAGEDRNEIQANQFAAALLMPKELLLGRIRARDFDLGDEYSLASLAAEFEVSSQAMTYRLSNLGIFESHQEAVS